MIFSRIFYFIRLFSLDIIAGALASLVFSSSVMGIDLPRTYYTILALTVWLIYTADHLMDGAKTRGKSASDTHNFFYKFKVPVILLFLMVLVFTFRLAMYRLDEKIIEFGMTPAITVIIYLLLNRYYGNAYKWFFIKELWIALIYTLAIWGGPVIYAGDVINYPQMMMITSFGLIIFSNVLIYSVYEYKSDTQDNNKSFVRDFGLRAAVNTVVYSLAIAILIALSAFLFPGINFIQCIPVILISALMLMIISFPGVFSVKKIYGIIADLSLLLFLLTLYS
jgi:4-hydroxybenzoate polyprenyltransferase